jgi:hypothetical protein
VANREQEQRMNAQRKNGSFAGSDERRGRRKLTYVKSASEVPAFRSDDEIARWYQTHSTVLIQDQLRTLPAAIGGKLRTRVAARQLAQPKARRSSDS